jgi:hypothetical protein
MEDRAMSDDVKAVPDDRLDMDLPVDERPTAGFPFDARRLVLPQALPAFSWWSVGALILAAMTACAHLGVWWKENGTMVHEFMLPGTDLLALFGVHFVSLVVGVGFAVAGVGQRSRNRWFSWVVLLLTFGVAVAGVAWLRHGWTHVPGACGVG